MIQNVMFINTSIEILKYHQTKYSAWVWNICGYLYTFVINIIQFNASKYI